LLDGLGSAVEIAVADIQNWSKEQGVLWLHFDYTHPEAEEWLMESSGLAKIIAQALLEDETRPHATMINNGMLIALRGINHNPSAEADDMVALRMWVDPHRIVTSLRRKLGAADIIATDLMAGSGPKNSGDFLVSMINHIVHGMSDTVNEEVLTRVSATSLQNYVVKLLLFVAT
jgi:zinc transporter